MTTATAERLQLQDGVASIPDGALRCEIPADAVRLGDNGDSATSAPVEILARTGDPIDHWYWGRFVHDLEGMEVKRGRCTIDWRHDLDQIIGYLNRFETTTGDLVCGGAITPYRDSDRGSEFIHKSALGVPYEASIDFSGPLTLEEVGPGDTVEVNGRTLSGPLLVIRKWTLRSVAITPQGADSDTAANQLEQSDGQRVAVEFSTMEADMAHEAQTPEDASTDTDVLEPTDNQTTEPDGVEVENGQQLESPEAPGDVETQPADTSEPSELEQRRAAAATFRERFGDRLGADYFADGLTLEQATERFTQHLQDDNAALRQRLQAMTDAEPEPIGSTPETPGGEAIQKRAKQMERQGVPAGVSRLAAKLEDKLGR